MKNYEICLHEIETRKAALCNLLANSYKTHDEKLLYAAYYLGNIHGFLQTIFFYNEEKCNEIEKEIKPLADKIFGGEL